MILTVSNFPGITTAVSVSYSLFNVTTATTVQAYTVTGVVEVITNGTADKSAYYVDSPLILADNEYIVSWKTGQAVPLTASEGVSVLQTASLLDYGATRYNAANSSVQFNTNLAETAANFPMNSWVKFISGALQDQVQKVAGYAVSGGVITTSLPFTATPVTASFTGAIAATALTFPSVTAGTVVIGQQVTGVGVAPNTIITAGAGLAWTVTPSQTVGSVAMFSGDRFKIINQ